jgi:hypothetical protein
VCPRGAPTLELKLPPLVGLLLVFIGEQEHLHRRNGEETIKMDQKLQISPLSSLEGRNTCNGGKGERRERES